MSTGDPARLTAEHLGSRIEFETLISDTSAALFAAPPATSPSTNNAARLAGSYENTSMHSLTMSLRWAL